MDKDQVIGRLFEETCPAVIITDNGFFVVQLTTGPPGHKMAQGAQDQTLNNCVTSASCYHVSLCSVKVPDYKELCSIDVPANPLYRTIAYCQGAANGC